MAHDSPPPGAASSSALARARRSGPIPYSALGRPARTPPPPGLGAWLARALDQWWAELGRPDPYLAVEVGAGDGQRAAEVLGHSPACARALRYVLVEEDPAMAAAQGKHLPLVPPALISGPVLRSDPDLDPAPPPGIGPLVTSLQDLPVAAGTGAVVAVGWLSTLASDRFVWAEQRWWELRFAASGGSLTELKVPLDERLASRLDALVARERREGSCYAWQETAVSWLATAKASLERGKVAVVDRCSPLTMPVSPGEAPPVALDQLERLGKPSEARWGDPFPWSTLVWDVG